MSYRISGACCTECSEKHKTSAVYEAGLCYPHWRGHTEIERRVLALEAPGGATRPTPTMERWWEDLGLQDPDEPTIDATAKDDRCVALLSASGLRMELRAPDRMPFTDADVDAAIGGIQAARAKRCGGDCKP